MGIFGWSLPPGCTQQHIDEAYGGDEAAEAFAEEMSSHIPSTIDDEIADDITKWTWKQIGEAYARGYQQGQADALNRDD